MRISDAEIDALHSAMKRDPKQAGASRLQAKRLIEQLHTMGWLVAKFEDRLSLTDAAMMQLERADE